MFLFVKSGNPTVLFLLLFFGLSIEFLGYSFSCQNSENDAPLSSVTVESDFCSSLGKLSFFFPPF